MKHGYMNSRTIYPKLNTLQAARSNLSRETATINWQAEEEVSIDEAKAKVVSMSQNILIANGKTWR